jgi:hypothetical protein
MRLHLFLRQASNHERVEEDDKKQEQDTENGAVLSNIGWFPTLPTRHIFGYLVVKIKKGCSAR